MKKGSSSKKKRVWKEEDHEMKTPRVKKSYSVTNTHYLQLQIETSGKKRECMERTLQGKDRRIRDLEHSLKEHQDALVQQAAQSKEMKQRYQNERQKNQRYQQELQQAVELCRLMKLKCNQLIDQKQAADQKIAVLEAKAKSESQRFRELKELRRAEKAEGRKLMAKIVSQWKQGSGQISEEVEGLIKMF